MPHTPIIYTNDCGLGWLVCSGLHESREKAQGESGVHAITTTTTTGWCCISLARHRVNLLSKCDRFFHAVFQCPFTCLGVTHTAHSTQCTPHTKLVEHKNPAQFFSLLLPQRACSVCVLWSHTPDRTPIDRRSQTIGHTLHAHARS